MSKTETKAKPFLKWVGGKRRVIPEIMSRMPSKFNDYYEPFIGGGALFFHLKNLGLLDHGNVILSDANERLIRTYQAIRDDVDGVIIRLKGYQAQNCERYFYKTRSYDYDHFQNNASVAAWMIYLNRTCFNGLYRVNKKNEFNSSWGKYKNPNICDEENLRACSAALQGVEILLLEFDWPYKSSTGDFFYFDPPYVPVSKTSSFTAYTGGGFGSEDQARLRDYALRLKEKGVQVMLSNSDCGFVRDLYQDGFDISSIKVGRAINSKADGRGKVGEVLIV